MRPQPRSGNAPSGVVRVASRVHHEDAASSKLTDRRESHAAARASAGATAGPGVLLVLPGLCARAPASVSAAQVPQANSPLRGGAQPTAPGCTDGVPLMEAEPKCGPWHN
jgi:hypothetical protein